MTSGSMMIMQQPGKFKLGRFDPETHRQGEAVVAGRSKGRWCSFSEQVRLAD